jgi:hypothetical protein
VAIDLIMGHSDPSMGGRYRERVEDSRLLAVVEHVRQWLFGEPPDNDAGEPETVKTRTGPRQDTGRAAKPTLKLFAG